MEKPTKCISERMNTITIDPIPKKYVKQHPYVDDTGIWVPIEEYVPEGYASCHRLVMTKEVFIEAYNRYIKENTSEVANSKINAYNPKCHKCINEIKCKANKICKPNCPDYKRDAPDGGYYG